jgi:hypothetical protein
LFDAALLHSGSRRYSPFEIASGSHVLILENDPEQRHRANAIAALQTG